MRGDTLYYIPRWCRPMAAAVLVLLLLLMAPQGLMAEDGSGDWRPTYDLAMRWINFFILVFLILKYARKPLVNFFREKSEDVRREIQAVEKEKEEVLARVADMLAAREHSQEKLEKLKGRILSQGRAKKQRIIEDARKESEMMLESARRKIENQMAAARKTIRAEMIDLAIEMALDKLPGVIAEEDNQKLYRQYLANTESPSPR